MAYRQIQAFEVQTESLLWPMIQISYMLKKSSGKFLFFKNSHIFNLITDDTSTELQFLRGLLRNKNIRYLIFINSKFQKQLKSFIRI